MYNIIDIKIMKEEQNIAKLIKNRRLSLNLTMDYLAKKVGITRATLSAIEKGSTNCTFDSVLRILLFLNMNIVINTKNETKSNRRRATRTLTKLDKDINRFVVMSVEVYALSVKKDSSIIYDEMLKKGIINKIKKEYEKLHLKSSEYLNNYYSALVKEYIGD